MLLCKDKRQYLLACKASRYCLLLCTAVCICSKTLQAMSTVALGDGNAVETSFTDLSKCNNDTGHPQVENGGRGGTRRGFYVTHVVAAVYVMITICLVVAVALIVHFAHPCRKSCKCTGAPPGGEQGDQTTTDPEDDEAMWLRCLELSRERDQCN